MTDPTEKEIFDSRLGDWRLSSTPPAPDLADAVLEYWEVEGAVLPFRESLLPNGAVELMFNLAPPHRVLSNQGLGQWQRAWYSGLQECALVIETLSGTHLVSARLHPLGAVTVLGEAAAHYANRIIDLQLLLGNAGALRGELLGAATPAERFALLDEFLRVLAARPGASVPTFVRHAALQIEAAHGALPVSELHQKFDVSRRHLSVTFARFVGLSLKRYAAIQRFIWTLEQLRQHASVDWARLAIQAGYSDQSHLARDFRRVGAATPTEYLRRSTPDMTALLDQDRSQIV
jgi:AraC-like DNA-binding protein